MGEHVGLAGARAGDDEERGGSGRLAEPVLDRGALGVVKLAEDRTFANRCGRHRSQESCFALCSKPARRARALSPARRKIEWLTRRQRLTPVVGTSRFFAAAVHAFVSLKEFEA